MPSLIDFIEEPEVIEKLAPLRPKTARQLSVSLLIEPRSKRYQIVGTAFDYMLRFELQRRVPTAVARAWVAEQAPALVLRMPTRMKLGDLRESDDFEPGEVVDVVGSIVSRAKKFVAAYVRKRELKRSLLAQLAEHAIGLARLDILCRANWLAPDLESVGAEDVEDLLRMFDATRFESLILGHPVLLNPVLGDPATCGADADLIAGEYLIDLKTSTKAATSSRDLDQLLGYFLLARHRRLADSSFPEIRKVGIYYARHGHLREFATAEWTSQPAFLKTEKWFMAHARRR